MRLPTTDLTSLKPSPSFVRSPTQTGNGHHESQTQLGEGKVVFLRETQGQEAQEPHLVTPGARSARARFLSPQTAARSLQRQIACPSQELQAMTEPST